MARAYGSLVRVDSAAVGSLGIEVADAALEASVVSMLADVECRLREALHSDHALVAEASLHLVEAGGKRLRPLLVALASQFGDGDPVSVRESAIVVELTHVATLYHDDVMDEAAVRRSAPSANARWSNSVAILVGDFLFSQAAKVAAQLGPEAVRIQAETFARLVHGQIAETIGPQSDEDPITHYLNVIAEKTGSLIATSARFGAMFGGASGPQIEALATYGETIGIAFQLSDDLLDIASESEQSGKTPGTDLREGVPTLPVLYALASADASPDAVRLRQILAKGPITDDADHAEALALLRQSDAMKLARETVRSYAETARSQLNTLPPGGPREALESLCDFVADRTG